MILGGVFSSFLFTDGFGQFRRQSLRCWVLAGERLKALGERGGPSLETRWAKRKKEKGKQALLVTIMIRTACFFFKRQLGRVKKICQGKETRHPLEDRIGLGTLEGRPSRGLILLEEGQLGGLRILACGVTNCRLASQSPGSMEVRRAFIFICVRELRVQPRGLETG